MKTDIHFSIISRSVLLRSKNIFQKKFLDKLKTHILCTMPPPQENCAIYEIMWENLVEPDAWALHAATNTHTGCEKVKVKQSHYRPG